MLRERYGPDTAAVSLVCVTCPYVDTASSNVVFTLSYTHALLPPSQSSPSPTLFIPTRTHYPDNAKIHTVMYSLNSCATSDNMSVRVSGGKTPDEMMQDIKAKFSVGTFNSCTPPTQQYKQLIVPCQVRLNKYKCVRMKKRLGHMPQEDNVIVIK